MEYNQLKVRSLRIDTYRENIIYMRSDCNICMSEGFTALTRLEVQVINGTKIIATLNVIDSDLLKHDEAGLSVEAIKRLTVKDGDLITISHMKPVDSMAFVRGKMFGKSFTDAHLFAIMKDITEGRYSNVELAAFITTCSGRLSIAEIIALTRAMIKSGNKLKWDKKLVLDKHSIGGIPGNRTTPIVVSIIAAGGYTIPKTSSRAITSPAGTADMMEVITNVSLDVDSLRAVVHSQGGCMAWGGSINLSPVDDIIITVEKILDIDSEGQMIASVLSKKAAAGSTHVLIDIPVGKTAKVRTREDAERLDAHFRTVGNAIGLYVTTMLSDGSQPVGVGIGPALEAMDVLAVLHHSPDAPADLKQKAISIAGKLFDMADGGLTGTDKALNLLESGVALEKFKSICLAQGAWKEPQFAEFSFDVRSVEAGVVTNVNNRELARVAKLAGAPRSPSSGLQFFAPVNKEIATGDILFRIWAETNGELEYAKEYLRTIPNLITLG